MVNRTSLQAIIKFEESADSNDKFLRLKSDLEIADKMIKSGEIKVIEKHEGKQRSKS